MDNFVLHLIHLVDANQRWLNKMIITNQSIFDSTMDFIMFMIELVDANRRWVQRKGYHEQFRIVFNSASRRQPKLGNVMVVMNNFLLYLIQLVEANQRWMQLKGYYE